MRNQVFAIVAAAALAVASTPAFAFGNGGRGGDADARSSATGVGVGVGIAGARSSSDSDARAAAIGVNRNYNSLSNRNYSSVDSYNRNDVNTSDFTVQGQDQGQYQGQGQGIEAFNGNTTVVNPGLNVDFDSRDLVDAAERHAETAPRSESSSAAAASPCGDSTGLSGQTGVAGGGLATITETCRAYRLQVLQSNAPESWSTKLAAGTHYAGWFFRTLLHIGSFGVLN